MAKITTPDSLYGNSRDILREAERENEILADIAGEEYESPGDIPKGKYVIEKRLLDAAQKKNELLESIAEGGGTGGSGAAKAIGIDYATDIISLKNKNGDVISGSGATLPAYGVTFDPTTGGLTLTKNGTAVSGQTVTIPNYGSPVGVTSSSDMTDHDTIYLYEGTTSGSYTNGHFYYWDGTAWADGGEYAAATVQTDKTLLVEDRAADAKATGEAVGELKTQIDNLYVNETLTAENEIILTGSPFITGAQITGSTECIVRNAQIFEAVYPGTSGQYGVQVTKNDDGSYTLDGVATSGAIFNLNQSTRTGTDNQFALSNGKYSFTAEIISGTIEKNTASTNSLMYVGIFEPDVTTITTTPMKRVFEYGSEYTPSITLDNFGTESTIIAVRLTTGVKYNNVRIRIMANKGDPLEWAKYKTPTTVATPFDDLASIINNYNPLAWVIAESGTIALTTGETPKEYTDAEISELKDYVDDEIDNIPVYDRFGIIEKYNDRIDALAQLFTKNLLLLIYTDIHGNEINLNRINTWKANNKPIYVNDTYCLGDMVYNDFSDAERDIEKLNAVPIWAPTLKVIGNHDVSVAAGVGPTVTANQAYNTYIAPYVSGWSVIQPENASTDGKNYYYKDYIKYRNEQIISKIRVIVLDTYFYTVDQHNWFVATLESARTNGFSVIVMQHEDICKSSEKQPLNADYPFGSKHIGYYNLYYRTYGNGGDYQTKRNAVDAFIAAGGEFICWLSGHMHTDMTGYYQGEHGKQLSIVLSNASNSMTSSIRIDNYCQDCFTYFAVDTDSKYVYLLRIGVDVDEWYHKNTFLCYDYHKLGSGEEEPGANRVIEYN